MPYSLRLKLLIIPLLLLFIPLVAIPLFSLRFNNSMESELIKNQEDALIHTAQTISAALNGHSDLFYQEKPIPRQQEPKPNTIRLPNPIILNGEMDDWQPEIDNADIYGKEHLLASNIEYTPESFSFRYLEAKQGQYLYALFDVRDDYVIYRKKNTLRLDRSDYVQIIIDKNGEQRKYIVTCHEPGWVIGFYIQDESSMITVTENRIHGVWEQTDSGYILEIRIHEDLLGSKIGFIVGDVDDHEPGMINAQISTTKLIKEKEPDIEISKSNALDDILKLHYLPSTRIRIIAKNNQVKAEIGERDKFSDQLSTEDGKLTPLSTEVILQGVSEAFEGKSIIVRYFEKDSPVEIKAAITPVYSDKEVIAAAIVEKTPPAVFSFEQPVI